MTSRVVYNSPSWFFSLTLFVVTRSEIMSDNEEMLGDFSSEESETVQYSDEEDAGGYFVFNGDFAPYQGEPLASSGDDMEDNGADEEEDEDGILPSVLEQRFEGGVVVNNWYAVIHAFYYFFFRSHNAQVFTFLSSGVSVETTM